MLAIGELAILAAIIMGLLIYSLTSHRRESRLINDYSTLKRETTETEKKNNNILISRDKEIAALQITKSKREDTIHKLQEQIAEQERKLGIFSKYTFDPSMSFFRLENKGYCSICMFTKFQEQELGISGNQFKCPSCGTDYARTSGMVVISDYFKPLNDKR